MTDTPRVVVPYNDFQQRRDQRQRVASELSRQHADVTADLEEADATADVTEDVEAGTVAVARALPPPAGQPPGDDEHNR